MRPRILLPLGLLLAVAIIVVYGYFGNAWWTWEGTGFSGADLWDWLDLLIVPAALAFGVYWLNQAQSQREKEIEARRRLMEKELEAQRAQEAALQGYFERMTRLLTEQPVNANSGTVARAQTLAVLEGMDPDRKRILLQFLYESNQIKAEKAAISLWGAELQGANLQGANLQGANLQGVNLQGANLQGVNLQGADLRGADLRSADLRSANLSDARLRSADLRGANLRDAEGVTNEELEQQAYSLEEATMPDGSVHE